MWFRGLREAAARERWASRQTRAKGSVSQGKERWHTHPATACRKRMGSQGRCYLTEEHGCVRFPAVPEAVSVVSIVDHLRC